LAVSWPVVCTVNKRSFRGFSCWPIHDLAKRKNASLEDLQHAAGMRNLEACKMLQAVRSFAPEAQPQATRAAGSGEPKPSRVSSSRSFAEAARGSSAAPTTALPSRSTKPTNAAPIAQSISDESPSSISRVEFDSFKAELKAEMKELFAKFFEKQAPSSAQAAQAIIESSV
jgi:hypothetical protein